MFTDGYVVYRAAYVNKKTREFINYASDGYETPAEARSNSRDSRLEHIDTIVIKETITREEV